MDKERLALIALREALRNLSLAQVRFNTGRTGANWFKIQDVALYSDSVEDNGHIIVLLEASEKPFCL